jgi:hypothetical protein
MAKRIIAAAFTATVLGCGSSTPSGPTTFTGPVQYLRIQLPGPIVPGSTAQLRAYAERQGMPSEDVTTRATWSSTDDDTLRVSSGLATALRDGEAGVRADYLGVSARVTILILSPGTFRIDGRVLDVNFGVAGARVDVVAGTGTGKSATTDADGTFKLYGVAGAIRLRVTADEYQTVEQAATIANNQNLTVHLAPARVPASMAGTWRLAFAASGSCTLPEAARQRPYDATVDQNGSSVVVRLSGAAFAFDPAGVGNSVENTFFGHVLDDALTIRLVTYEYYGTHYDLGELIPNVGTYTVTGQGTATVSATTVSGLLDGTIALVGTSGPPSRCAASDHRFTFTRATTTAARRTR